MRLYEATLYVKPSFGDPYPVTIDGRPVSREIVAENAGKARYSYFRDLRECWGDEVRIQDIRVRSLASRAAEAPMADGWQSRLDLSNSIIRVMASFGRRFFSENSDRRSPVDNPFIAHFMVDRVRELWFVDRYTRKPILVRHTDWPGFSDGGTLRQIIRHLAAHIGKADPINPRHFGPFPEWQCGGDLWGYGDDMPKVTEAVAAILHKERAA